MTTNDQNADNTIASLDDIHPQVEVDDDKPRQKKKRQKAFRAFTTYLLSVLGGLLLILLLFGTLLDLGVFAAWKRFSPDVRQLVLGLFASAIGVLCLTLGIERKIEFDNIDTTLERLNESIVNEYERRERQETLARTQLNNISIALRFIDANFLGADNSFDIFWGISLLKARARNELIDPETFIIKRPDVPRFWLQMINSTDSSWFCTDRIEFFEDDSADLFWKRRIPKRGLIIQGNNAKNHGVIVRRLFIFDKHTDAETPFIQKMMHGQASFKIDVGWVSFESKLRDAPLSSFQTKLGTVDFTIVNNKYLFSYEMVNKSVESIRCTSNQALVTFVRGQYDLLFHESNRLTSRHHRVGTPSGN